MALVGCTVGYNIYGSSPSDEATGITTFDGFVGPGRPMAANVQKIFFGEGVWPSSIRADYQAIINAGGQLLVCFKPSRTLSTSEQTNLANAITLFKNAYTAASMPANSFKVVLWQEANDGSSFASGSAYKTYFQFYQPTVAAAGIDAVYCPGSGGGTASWTSFYPGDAYVQAILVDFYGNSWKSGIRLDVAQSLADNHLPSPIPFGLGEWNNCTSEAAAISHTDWTSYTNYIISFFQSRITAGKPNSYIIMYMGFNASSISDDEVLSSGDYKIPQIKALYDALSASAPAPTSPAGILQPLLYPINIFTGSSAPPPPPPPSPTSAGLTGDYGIFNIDVSNTAGNGLVAFLGWNSVAFPQCPISSVADDAHNYWIHLGTTAAGSTMRCSIWIAPNAQPATFVSVGTSLPTSGITGLIAELPSLPVLAQPGFTAQVATSGSTTGLMVSTAAAAPVFAFAVAATGNNTDAVTPSGSPWTALGTVEVNDPGGAGGPADTAITPLWGAFPAGSVSASFTTGAAVPMAVCMTSILQSPVPVTYPNPDMPAMKLEAAFGSTPGDPTAMPTWTDITARARSAEGDSIVETSRGRAYELTQPEAGQSTIWLDNSDGALTPLNGSSPYSPNVRLELPVRLSATWADRTYGIAYGRVDKFPQQWPDPEFPQYGWSPMEMSDGIGVLANLTLYSAYRSEVLFDNPYTYYPLDESYGEAHGLPFSNLAPTNAKPMLGIDGLFTPAGVVQLSTGLTLNMNGDTGTGIGMSGVSSQLTTLAAGALCVDPGLPQPASGLTVEFWAVVDPGSVNSSTPLVTLAGPWSNYPQNGGPVRFQVGALNIGTNQLVAQVVLSDFAGNVVVNTAGTMPVDKQVHHHVYTVSVSGSTTTVKHYLDGVFDKSFTTTAVTLGSDVYELIVGPAIVFPLGAFAYNYTVGHLAVYSGLLPTQRIAAHYACGGQGNGSDSAFTRFKRIMAWGQSALPRAADSGSPNPLMGVADTQDSQDSASAIYDVMTSEGGQAYGDGQGNIWYQSRIWLYDQTPKWVFGDNTANGETPYLPEQSFDFDNTFLYNSVTGQRQIAVNQLVTTSTTLGSLIQQFRTEGAAAVDVDVPSEIQYGRRNSLQQTVLTTSDQDAYDRAAWSLAKYKDPHFRMPTLTLDPASNPDIFPVALGVEQGDVVQVIRRPLGAAPYTVTGVVQQVSHDIGPSKWLTTIAISPLDVELNVLRLGDATFGTMSQTIGW